MLLYVPFVCSVYHLKQLLVSGWSALWESACCYACHSMCTILESCWCLDGVLSGTVHTARFVCRVRILRKNTLPSNLAAHILPIEHGIRNAITQKSIPLHVHMKNLVIALNKHHAQCQASPQGIQPHIQARLRHARIRNSKITTKISESATIMFGGTQLSFSLTFVMDSHEENDICTLLKADIRDVHCNTTGEGDSTTVTSPKTTCTCSVYF
jgi:hypothetical protein